MTRALAIAGAAWLVAVGAGCSRPSGAHVDQEAHAVNQAEDLPEELEAHRAAIQSSRLEYVEISARKATGTSPWESKFLGQPYLPRGGSWPVDPTGKPLSLLAQIDFADVPRLEGYPSEGILQFFLSGEDSEEHVFGMRQHRDVPFDAQRWFDALQEPSWFRVVYHPQVTKDRERLEAARAAPPIGLLPIDDEAALTFSKRSECVRVEDYRFGRILGQPPAELFAPFEPREDEVAEAYSRFAGARSLAKIGGYGAFVQGDPRTVRPEEDWLILLEIDSSRAEDGVEVMWGDAGVANFLIRRADLERLDFSRVAFYWDCH